jgi:hypothetical protein
LNLLARSTVEALQVSIIRVLNTVIVQYMKAHSLKQRASRCNGCGGIGSDPFGSLLPRSLNMGPVQRLNLRNGLHERFWYVAEPLLNGGNVCCVRSSMAHGTIVCEEIPNDLTLLFERESRKTVLEHNVAGRSTTTPGVRLDVVRVPRKKSRIRGPEKPRD